MMSNRLFTFPSVVYCRVGVLAAIPVALLTLASALMMARLNAKEAAGFDLPPRDPYQQLEQEIRSSFASAEFIVIAVESAHLYARETVLAVDRLSREIGRHPAMDSVVSVTTARTISVREQELVFSTLYDANRLEGNAGSLRDRIQQDPLLCRYLLSRDGKAFHVYAFPRPGADEETLVRDLKRYLGRETGVRTRMYGTPVMRAEMAWQNVRELARLGTTALLLVFVLEVLFTRSLLHALLLWLTALLPAAWTLGLFGLFGLKLETTNFFVPIMVLGLATSYGIHVFRFRSHDPRRPMQQTLDEVSPIILSAAFTTVVGFCSLLVSPIHALRILGGMLILGIVLAAAAALLFLPALMARAPMPQPLRVRSRSGAVCPRHPGRLPIAFGLIVAVSAAGIPLIRHDYRLGVFRPGSEVGQTLAYFYERSGGIDEMELFVQTGREYGLIDLELFRGIRSVSARLQQTPHVAQVICFCDFVEWAHGGMQGADRPLAPETEEIIGETLELLASGQTGLGIDRLVDPAYSKTRLLIRFGISSLSSGQSARRLHSIRAAIRSLMDEELPGLEYHLIGYPLKYERRLLYLIRGLLSGLALYLPLLFLFLLLVFRSLRLALVTMIPTVAAMVLYLGMMGWLRIPLNYCTALSTAIVLGVSVDDVLVLVLSFRRQCRISGYREAIDRTRAKVASATIQTTLIIVVGLSVLCFSMYTTVMHSGILASASLCFATAATLLVVPWLLGRLAPPLRSGRG